VSNIIMIYDVTLMIPTDGYGLYYYNALYGKINEDDYDMIKCQ